MTAVIRVKPNAVARRLGFSLPLVAFGCTGSVGENAPPPDGAAVFQMACVRCHGPEGHGDGPLAATFGPVPDLAALSAPDQRARYPRAELEALVRAGRGKMPAHQGRLGAAELNAVLDHVERRFLARAVP